MAGSLNEVRLTFDEPVDPLSATNLVNYQVVGVPLQAATLDATGRGLTLHAGPLVRDQRYVLTLSGVRDRAAAGNALTTTTEFVPAVSYVDEVLADHPVRYWRLDGTNGATTASLVSQRDSAATAAANLANAPEFGVAGLVPNVPAATAVRFTATNSQRLLVPNGSDLNANAGPWAKRSVQFWFQADRVPAPGTTGLAATAGLWEEGGANRTLTVYLWRDPANVNADEADLILNAVNNLADGPGSPFGPPENPAVFARARVWVGEVYHVVAVFDGDATGFNGSLVLYLNGAEAGRAVGVGQLYNHTSDIQIGRGNARTHVNDNGDFGFFDGLIDEVSVFNTALSADRVAQLYQFARTAPSTVAPGRISSITVQPGKLVIAWTGPGRLGVADSLAGPYIPVADAANPHTESLTGSQQRFFQVLP